MKIWYDACTGKHMRYGHAIAERFRKAGHKVVLTTREHPDTLALAQALGEKATVVGRYAPESLSSRLRESLNRTVEFSEMFKDDLPDVAIAHQSVELCRTAFGLGVPIVLTADTPHATAVNKLTIPLSSTLVASEAVPQHFFRGFGAQRIVQFKGVDEVAWAGEAEPPKACSSERPLIVVREMETQASYALDRADETLKLAIELASLGEVLFLSRYNRVDDERLTVERGFVDTMSTVAGADLVVSVGGTMSREAALQGVPSLATSEMGRTYVNRYLAEKGFPLFMVKPSQVLGYARKYVGRRFDVRTRLTKLENPVDVIEKIVNERELA